MSDHNLGVSFFNRHLDFCLTIGSLVTESLTVRYIVSYSVPLYTCGKAQLFKVSIV